MRASFSLGIPGAAAVVALRHPLLDGHTFVDHESVPEKEWERSGNASRIGRDFRLKNYRRPFGPQPQVCWTFVMSLRFLRALPSKAGLFTGCWKGVGSESSALRLDLRARLHSRVIADAQKKSACQRWMSALQSEHL